WYLYQDAAGQKVYQERVRTHKGVAKALAFFDRLLLLAPKNVAVYRSLSGLYSFLEDHEALQRLSLRIDGASLDLEESDREMLEVFRRKKGDKSRKAGGAGATRHEEIVTAARKVGGATLAAALVTLAQTKMSRALLGLEVNANDLLALAEEAHQVAPS